MWGSREANNPNPKRSPGGRPWPRGLEIDLQGGSGDGIEEQVASSPENETPRREHFKRESVDDVTKVAEQPSTPSLVTLSTKGTAMRAPPGLLSPGTISPPPPEFVCPLTRRVMEEPAVAADGRSYELEALERYLRDGNTSSPATGAVFEHTLVVPNTNLRLAIKRWSDERASTPPQASGVAASLRGAPPVPVAPPPDRVRFSATPKKQDGGRDSGTVEWFVSKAGGQGYGSVRVDGRAGRYDGDALVTIRESSLGGVVLAAGDRVAFCHATVGNEVRAVDVELLPETVERVQARSSLAGARGVTPRALPVQTTPLRAITTPHLRPSMATPRTGGRTPKGERLTGTCTWFSENYGFLRPDNGSPDVFVHASAAPGGALRKDDRCEFRIATYNERARAVDVELILDRGFNHGPIGAPSPRRSVHTPFGQELAAHETKPFRPPRGFFGDGAF